MKSMLIATLAIGTVMAAPATAMTITSSDIADGKPIALAHIYPRCGGSNISPALSWSGAPAGTKSLVLTMIDTSVKPSGWSHWIVVHIPPATTGFSRGIAKLPEGATALASNFGDAYYDGPCPPKGTGVHNYQLTIWALDTADIQLKWDGPANDVAEALSKKVLDKATLTGTVER